MQQLKIRSRRDRDIATLADCLMQLLDLAMGKGEPDEGSAIDLTDIYNDVKPKLEELLRRSRYGTSVQQVPKQP